MKKLFRTVLLLALVSPVAAAAPTQSPPEARTGPFERECATLGRLIEQEVATQDASLLREFFDLEALLDHALAGLKGPKDLEGRLREGFKESFENSFRKPLTDASSFRLLRVRKIDGQTRALFRLVQTDAGPNYLDMVCGRGKDGTAKVVDVHLLAVGHRLSDAARRGFLLALAEAQGGAVEGASHAEKELLQHRAALQNFNRLAARNVTKEGFAAYHQLPVSLQKDKLVLATRLNLASQFNRNEHKAAIDLWRATFPNDPSVDLIAFDGFVLKKHYEEALAALDRLDKALGGDPYLDVLRGAQYFPMGQPDVGRRLIEKAAQREPGLARVADSMLVSVALPEFFRLQGILYSRSNPSAIIDGKTVSLGTAVGRFQVKQIERDAVTLESPSGQTRVLALKDSAAP